MNEARSCFRWLAGRVAVVVGCQCLSKILQVKVKDCAKKVQKMDVSNETHLYTFKRIFKL
jgi:hypothetical protein